MKITQKQLRKIIREEFRPMTGQSGSISKWTDPKTMSSLEEIRDAIGDENFIAELINQMPDQKLKDLVVRIAKARQLEIGGVKYL